METDTIQTDNLLPDIEVPSIEDDNSDEITDDKPEIEESQEKDTEEDSEDEDKQEKILGKFNSDEDVRNGYLELEKKTTQLSQEKSEWEKEKALLQEKAQQAEQQQLNVAKMYGYSSVDELNNYLKEQETNTQLAQFTANEYAKFLNSVDYPDDVRDMLLKYQQNPDKALLENIEAEFPLETIKQVSENVAYYKGQLANQRQQALMNEERAYLENYLQETITKHKDVFEDKNVVALFGEAFKQLGAFDSDIFIQHIKEVQKSAIQNYLTKQKADKENSEALSALEGLNPTSNGCNTGEKSVLEMTPDELRREFKKYKD